MIGLKVTIHVLGLNPDAWYVWPFSWVAFGMMVPCAVELVTKTRKEW